jgi:Pyruvate/2-oxoacid:ferredoxin oxidoreductase delta subunit
MQEDYPIYDKLIIYYFSGTGNAKNAAQWIISAAKKQGIDTQLVNIDRFESIEKPEILGKTLIGFCSPTHGFNLPPIMLKFICQFPKIKNTDVFILNTRAGMKLHKLFVPGLSGLAQIFPALTLRIKGFQIAGMQPLDLPSNWIFFHPGLKKKVVDSIYNRCYRITNNFAQNLFQGEKRFKALLSLPIDLLVIPIAIAYYLFGRFFLAKTLIASEACNNCKKCIRQCPVEAISLLDDRPYWSYKCESCMRCVNICPERAIETAHTFSLGLFFVSSFILSPFLIKLLKYFGVWSLFNQSYITGILYDIIVSIIFIIIVIISYRGLHYLMKNRWVNRMITYTSLSKFKFWRRYKSPKTTIANDEKSNIKVKFGEGK